VSNAYYVNSVFVYLIASYIIGKTNFS